MKCNQQLEKVDFQTIIIGSENFQNLCGLMRRELENANKLKSFLKRYVENTGVNIEKQFRNKDVDEYKNAIKIDIKSKFNNFKRWNLLRRLAKIKSSAMNSIVELQRFISDYMYNKAIFFTKKTVLLYYTIAISPITVEQFVNYMDVMNIINNQFENLSNFSQEITQWMN